MKQQHITFRTLCLLMGACLILSGCQAMYQQLVRPRPWGMGETPEGSTIFKQGWNDGCDTGLGVYGNDRYKWAYTYKQDMTLLSNPEYYRAWKDAYTYCRWYVWTWLRPW
ncbi:MAG: hypothetical protein H6908_02830 [Hyphomicrobiales bacterium]|nr:hypothetical protein [Rickettsiales bacterium]MCP5361564.1 hypothetical protein [Hyphomicrobiales bacterium]